MCFAIYLVLLMWQYWYWIQAIPFVGVGGPSSVFLLEYHFYLGTRPPRLLKKLQKPFFALQKLLFAELFRAKDFLRLHTSWLKFCEENKTRDMKVWNESFLKKVVKLSWEIKKTREIKARNIYIFGKSCQIAAPKWKKKRAKDFFLRLPNSWMKILRRKGKKSLKQSMK